MDVSVVMPVHNLADYIGEAVESVLSQPVDAKIEVIIVDDASTDNTLEVAQSIGDARIRTFTIPKGGTSAARNFALDRARGRYIGFLDADDRWLPSYLETHLSILEAEPQVGFVFSDFGRFREDRTFPDTHFSFIPSLLALETRAAEGGVGRVIEGDTFIALMETEIFPTWLQATLLRADVLGGLRFDTGLRMAQDVDFMNRAYLRTTAAFTTEVVAELRRHEANTTLRHFETQEGYLRALVATRESGSLSGPRRDRLDRKIGQTIAGLGHVYFHRRRPFSSLRHYLRALAYPNVRVSAMKHLAALPLFPLLAKPDSTGPKWR